MDFENKVVLVTGASSGIGASIAQEFSKHGASVVLVGRNEAKLFDVAKKCEDNGKKPLAIIANITNDADSKRIVVETINEYGKLDILVNNAGTAGFSNIWASDAIDVFDRTMAINLRAAVCLSHFAAPYLIMTGENIINISSIGSIAVLMSGNFPYCTSKAGLDHFTRSIALDLASKGVRINSVNPGPVATDYLDTVFTDKTEREKYSETLTRSCPLGKIIQPNEIADLVLYLASDKVKSITGSCFVVDNGVLLKGSIN